MSHNCEALTSHIMEVGGLGTDDPHVSDARERDSPEKPAGGDGEDAEDADKGSAAAAEETMSPTYLFCESKKNKFFVTLCHSVGAYLKESLQSELHVESTSSLSTAELLRQLFKQDQFYQRFGPGGGALDLLTGKPYERDFMAGQVCQKFFQTRIRPVDVRSEEDQSVATRLCARFNPVACARVRGVCVATARSRPKIISVPCARHWCTPLVHALLHAHAMMLNACTLSRIVSLLMCDRAVW